MTDDRVGPVVVFLPARDEVATVADVVARVPNRVAGRHVEVVVIDDGSRDGTAEAARRVGAHLIAHDRARGLGAAVRTGLHFARTRNAWAVAFLDADGEYDPAELPRLLAPIDARKADYVVGRRVPVRWTDLGFARRVGNMAFTALTSLLAGRRLRDAQSGFRAISRRALIDATVIHDYNYAQVLTLALLRRGHRHVEVPISYRRRRYGRSFVSPGRYVVRVLPAMLRASGLVGGIRRGRADGGVQPSPSMNQAS